MKWETVPFGDLFAEKTRNGVYKPADFHGSGVKIVNMGELFAAGKIGSQRMERVELSESERHVSLLRENDLLFARRSLVESGAGKVSIVHGLTEETTFESSIIRVRLNTELCNPLFYYYWLSSFPGRAVILPLITGLNVKGIRGSELTGIKVSYPPLNIQNRISDILSAYDSLIENNQKQIKLLEEAAQRLYKEWFIDLRFPGYETTPIHDGIPEGWEVCTLNGVAKVNASSLPKNYAFDYLDYIDLSAISAGRIERSTRYSVTEAPGRAKRIAHDGDVIWGMVRPNLKSYALILHPSDSDVFSTGFAILSAETVPFTYLYCTVTQPSFVSYLVNCTNGAAYPAVRPEHFEKAIIIKPIDEILLRFHEISEPLFRKTETLWNQNMRLMEARDRLLPKLMSGEIEV